MRQTISTTIHLPGHDRPGVDRSPGFRIAIQAKLRDEKATDDQRAAFAWAAAHSKDARFIPDIATLAKSATSDNPHIAACRSLTVIGGEKAAKALVDLNTRYNAVHILGQWLIPPEAAKPFRERFWKDDIDILRNTSTIKDESRLKRLRERILQRGSDEAFSDHQMVNRIISMNRLLDANP